MKQFTTPCFLRTTSDEQRKRVTERLEELGYVLEEDMPHNGKYILTANTVIYPETAGTYYTSNIDGLYSDYVNCGVDESLFLALAAMNGGDDYMQWFVSDIDFKGVDFVLCKTDRFQLNQSYTTLHKATKEELVNHFNQSQ